MKTPGWVGWLPRITLALVFLTSARCEADRGPLPASSWLHHQGDIQVLQRTLPPRWANGTRWTIEYEYDSEWHHTRGPKRERGDYVVRDIEGDRAVVGAFLDPDHPTHQTGFIWNMRELRLESLPDRGMGPGPSNIDDPGWTTNFRAGVERGCSHALVPWSGPIFRATESGDVHAVLGERTFGDATQHGEVVQRTWVEGGLVRFELHPFGHDDLTLSVVWRPGDPWWAKYECFVPGRTVNAPTPLPKRSPSWGRLRWPEANRDARARLVAIDGTPVEPLPWEHPPTDWMDPSGR